MASTTTARLPQESAGICRLTQTTQAEILRSVRLNFLSVQIVLGDHGARGRETGEVLAHGGERQAHLLGHLQIEALTVLFQALHGFDHGTFPRLWQRGKASNSQSPKSKISPTRRLQNRKASIRDKPRARTIGPPGSNIKRRQVLEGIGSPTCARTREVRDGASHLILGRRFAVMNHKITKSKPGLCFGSQAELSPLARQARAIDRNGQDCTTLAFAPTAATPRR